MKITHTLLLGSMLALGFSSCIKHEIIPAPDPRVELICSFNGLINGSPLELTQNVNGYFLEAKKSIFVPPTGLTIATYFSEIKSAEKLIAIKISAGNMRYDGAGTDGPPPIIFNDFFKTNLTPLYTAEAVSTPLNTGGVEVSYRDNAGNVWVTKETDNGFNKMVFSSVVQETDKTGDYSKYVANFKCRVYHTFMTVVENVAPTPNDTTYDEQQFDITNGVMKGWYKR
ncbi:MAG: hypothetical protein PHQ74_06915 [Crocinitomicaceae bacterium]|nr:hypothetical protein [Crocinitomicaceae bacterium]